MTDVVLQKIVQQLTEAKTKSGQQLAQHLGVSRSTVWNAIQQLQAMGLDIYAVRGKGYHLAKRFELLDRARICQYLKGPARELSDRISVLWQTESTNAYLMRRIPQTGICLAEYQSQGRGRRGRDWVSPLGGNIYLSQSWLFSSGPMRLQGLSMACAVAVLRALTATGVQGLGLKWPNDIQLHGQKLAGLLLEISGESAGPCFVVVGLGLNVAMSEQAAQAIDQSWSSLDQSPATTQSCQRNYLAAMLINELTQVFQDFESTGLGPWLDDWKRYDNYKDKQVMLTMGETQRIQGFYRGVDELGHLLLQRGEDITTYASGEVSLRLDEGN